MEQISNYIRGIITIIIAWCFIEMLLPSGDMKKYARFSAGLVIVAIFIAPLANMKNFNIDDLNFGPDYKYSLQSTDSQIKSVYISKLKQEIKQKFNVDNVQISVDDNMRIIGVEASEHKAEIESYLGMK